MIFLYFVFVANILLLALAILKDVLFKSRASYKTTENGAWIVRPSPAGKFLFVILFLSWGSMIAFDEPWIKTSKGEGKVRCYDASNPLCVDGFLRRTDGETALVIALGFAVMLSCVLPLSEKGVIIDSCSIRKEREILPLNFSTKIAIKDVCLEKEMRGKMPILKIRDAKNRKNFTLGFPYAQRDIIFIEMLIYERLNKIAKFDPQKKISKDQNDCTKI